MALSEHYQIALTAWSSIGPSETVIKERHVSGNATIVVPYDLSWRISEWTLIILGPLSATTILIGLMFVLNHYKAKRERNEQRCKYFTVSTKPSLKMQRLNSYLQDLEKKKSLEALNSITMDLNNQQFFDEWELDQNKIILQNVLGEGAFGIVRKGSMEKKDGSKVEVAIKMLKGNFYYFLIIVSNPIRRRFSYGGRSKTFQSRD